MQCVGFDLDGRLVATSESSCDYVLLKSGDFIASQSLSPETIAESFVWGFATVLVIWSVSYAVRAVIQTIKLI